jgi:hypothetical protein
VIRCLFIAYLLVSLSAFARAESYADYVARHKRIQKMVNPMNVPVANALNDQWDANPEYANPNDRVATPGPKKFYIKSSRDDQGRVTCLPRPR